MNMIASPPPAAPSAWSIFSSSPAPSMEFKTDVPLVLDMSRERREVVSPHWLLTLQKSSSRAEDRSRVSNGSGFDLPPVSRTKIN